MATVVPAAPQISLQGVQKTYPNGTVALRDITLEIPKQDFVFLVGLSGAGKSTLVRLLIREEKVTAGTIQVEGQDLSRLKRRHLPYLRRKIDRFDPPLIQTVRGVGYVLRPPRV